MNKLILLGTAHMLIESEIGKYNSDILYDIINKIEPNIIFEETNLIDYNNIYVNKEKPQFIEHYIIGKYIEKYGIKNVPIDTLEKPNNFLELHNMLMFSLQIKNGYNNDLIELTNFIDTYINEKGIKGINSKYFEDLIIKRHRLFEYYIKNHKESLISCFTEYTNYNTEERENKMVDNILKYKNLNMEENNFNAIVLVGAVHKTAIRNKLINKSDIECELYYAH